MPSETEGFAPESGLDLGLARALSPPGTLRAGRTLGRTLYLVAPGDDRLADRCIGIVDTPELAAWIVEAVNAAADGPALRQELAVTPGSGGHVTITSEVREQLAAAGLAVVSTADLRLVFDHVTPGAMSPAHRDAITRISEIAFPCTCPGECELEHG
jgi:hypothetical protein